MDNGHNWSVSSKLVNSIFTNKDPYFFFISLNLNTLTFITIKERKDDFTGRKQK